LEGFLELFGESFQRHSRDIPENHVVEEKGKFSWVPPRMILEG
jgi:hypothetical protein